MQEINSALTKKGESSALVIGGGIAGLMTAKVLTNYYDQVVIVDRDAFPEKPDHRPGTPQAFHPHRFTQRGALITRELFPGFEEELLALGSPTSLNKKVYQTNQYGVMTASYPRNDIKFSRAALEWVLRNRLMKVPNVSIHQKLDVTGLLMEKGAEAISGVTIRERGTNGKVNTLKTDLIVDASGRFSKITKWLNELGFELPQNDKLKVDLGYSTCRYKLPHHKMDIADQWDVINIAADPKSGSYTGVFSFIENKVAELLLYRPGGQYPPTEARAYQEAINQLPYPQIAEIIQDLEPITTPRGYRVPEIVRHHFEKMEDWPAGLLVLGDAFCHYDPIFGQGMTVAAMEADALEKCLRTQQKNPEPQFEKRVLKKFQQVIEPAWWLNCANDLLWEGVEYRGSESLKGIAFGKKYMDLYLQYATTQQDWMLYGLYWSVNTLLVSPSTIMEAQMVKRVLSDSEEGLELLAKLEVEGPSLEEALSKKLPTFSSEVFDSKSPLNS